MTNIEPEILATFYAARHRDGQWKVFGRAGHSFHISPNVLTRHKAEAEAAVGHEVYVIDLVVREHHPSKDDWGADLPHETLEDEVSQ